MTPDIQELQALIAAERAKHEDFRTSVRKEILTQRFERRWCLAGTQGALKDLDLPPVTMTYGGEAWLRVRIDRVDGASNIDEARARVTRALDAVSADAEITMALEYVDPRLSEKEFDDR